MQRNIEKAENTLKSQSAVCVWVNDYHCVLFLDEIRTTRIFRPSSVHCFSFLCFAGCRGDERMGNTQERCTAGTTAQTKTLAMSDDGLEFYCSTCLCLTASEHLLLKDSQDRAITELSAA